MSIKCSLYVWEHSPHEGTDLLAELALADWSNDDGVSWYKMPAIARRARVKARQAKNVIRNLEAARTLYVRRGKGRVSSRYLLIMGRGAAELIPVLMEYYGLDKATATAIAAQLTEVQSVAPQTEGGNPVHPSDATGNTSEVQSGVNKQAESKGAVPVRKTDPSSDPSSDPKTIPSATSETTRRIALAARIEAAIATGASLGKREVRSLAADVVAFGADYMAKGDKHSGIQANIVLRHFLGEKAEPTKIAPFLAEMWVIYADYTKQWQFFSGLRSASEIIAAVNITRTKKPTGGTNANHQLLGGRPSAAPSVLPRAVNVADLPTVRRDGDVPAGRADGEPDAR